MENPVATVTTKLRPLAPLIGRREIHPPRWARRHPGLWRWCVQPAWTLLETIVGALLMVASMVALTPVAFVIAAVAFLVIGAILAVVAAVVLWSVRYLGLVP